jgi:hypothetical protein
MMITRRHSIFMVGASALALSTESRAVATDRPYPQPADWVDPLFTQPFTDIDEWRDKPVRHRYVHGGFKGTECLFSIYFPPKERYQGRFFQPVAAISGGENTAQLTDAQLADPDIAHKDTTIGFAIASGAYLLESNQGSKTRYPNADRTITGYRASAAAAKHSRTLAAEMYGPHRPYGYAYGGSGGGFKTYGFAQSTTGIWDGVVPYVCGIPNAIPSVTSVEAHAVRVLKNKFPAIVDAIDPGSNRDMYAGLNDEERAALVEVTRFGFPPRTWFAYQRLGYGPLSGLIDEIVEMDPQYFSHDFWNVPGYLGANPPESLKRARIQHFKTIITKIVMSDEAKKMAGLRVTMSAIGTNVVPALLKFASMPAPDLMGSTVTFASGGAKGQKISVSSVVGDLAAIDIGPFAFPYMKDVKVGDEVEIDNSIFLAAQTYHRHQVPSADFPEWDQFRGPDGKPIYPQRPKLIGPWVAQRATGAILNGQIHGKMIMVESLMDEYANPVHADWYHTKVKEVLGSRLDDSYRLWYTDHAMHSPSGPAPGPGRTRVVSYNEVLEQALRDLSAWVEKGVPPPTSTSYKVVDCQIQVPPGAAERKGIQPVVKLTANGGMRADVKVGQSVTFSGVVEVPPGTGKVVVADWDFEGTGEYPVAGEIKTSDASGSRATVSTIYSYTKPGTYFPALRAGSQRNPDGTPYARVMNLDRVRVVVT